jgi:hypothetical protein
LSFALQDHGFKAVITRQGSRDEIFTEARRVEAILASSSTMKSHEG